MKIRGPYLTLVAGLAVAGVMFGLSTAAHNRAVERQTKRTAATAAANAPAPPADQPAAVLPSQSPEPAPAPTANAQDAPAPAPGVDGGTYAGSTKGGDASVAVAVKGGTAIAYVCDGSKVEAWFQGPVNGTSVTMNGTKGSTMTATFAAGTLSGTVSAAGKTFTFNVKAVAPPSGLYRAAQKVAGASVVGGWIVTSDGRQVGMLDRGNGTETAAPPIDTATGNVTIDGTVIRAKSVDGTPTS